MSQGYDTFTVDVSLNPRFMESEKFANLIHFKTFYIWCDSVFDYSTPLHQADP